MNKIVFDKERDREDFETGMRLTNFTSFTGEGKRLMREIFELLRESDTDEMPAYSFLLMQLIARQAEILRLLAFGVESDRDCSKFIVGRAAEMVLKLQVTPLNHLTKKEDNQAHKLIMAIHEPTMFVDRTYTIADIRDLLEEPDLCDEEVERIAWQAAEHGIWTPLDDGTFFAKKQFQTANVEQWEFLKKRFG